MGLLYDAVAGGMWAYSNVAFRVTTLGPRRFRFRPGTLILVTHRRETDVPVICPPLYRGAQLARFRAPHERMSFAARDDMFLPGFFAGFPPELPPAARKALFRLDVAPWLPVVQVFPIRSASVARLGETLRERSDEPLSPQAAEPFERRAAGLGLPRPVLARDVLRGEYADLLWRPVTPADTGAELDGFWSARAARAAADFRRLVEIVRVGGTLLLFPEGRPSPDGEIGPVQRGLSALVRRAAPSAFLPVGVAYDPLVRGRTRVFVSIGDLVPSPERDVEAAALAHLRRAMPLTAGQLAAAGEEDAEGAVRSALAEGRPVEPDLLLPKKRPARLVEAQAAASSRPAEVGFLAREYTSARAG
jgi:1-acyl-sn-glycerol-3-phosphate acyltransferase